MIHARRAVHRATTSTCSKTERRPGRRPAWRSPWGESDGGRRSSIPSSWPRTAEWRRAKRSRSRRFSRPLRIPSTASSSKDQAGIRTPRHIQASGIAVRKLIRSRSVAAKPLSGTETKQARSVNRRLTAQARRRRITLNQPWPTTRQARRSEAWQRCCRTTTAPRRRSGLRRLPSPRTMRLTAQRVT